jgi:2-polyprenyl-3-methyl-5-hydroxy-6-metoxy-1,4-benzoquinol methylase
MVAIGTSAGMVKTHHRQMPSNWAFLEGAPDAVPDWSLSHSPGFSLSCGRDTLNEMFAAWNPAQPEITDLIVQHDQRTLERQPVHKQKIVEIFSRFGNRQALRAVLVLPEKDGVLDNREIDALLLTVHWEMQRLAEEFYHGHRVWELLRSVIAAIRASGIRETLRVVDVGCGIGYTTRWLAANVALADHNIEVIGMDLNSTLIAEANRLASAEKLPCQFLHADVFSAKHASHILLSTGVIHHFRGEALPEFLRQHDRPGAQAFLHFDFHPWFLAPFGALFFHVLRMRTAIARHDGVLSAARAYDGRTLTEAVRASAPGFAAGIYGAKIWGTPAPRVFHTLVGLRRELVPELRRQLGRFASRLEELR